MVKLAQGFVIALLVAGGMVIAGRGVAQSPSLPPSTQLPTEPFPDLLEPLDPATSPEPLPNPLPQPLEVSPNSPLNATPRPLPPPLPKTPAQPLPQAATTIFENVTLSPAFSPTPATVRGISGGALTATDLTGRGETATGPCSGFIDQQPDHHMLLTQFFSFLNLQVQSSGNTTLVVRGPGGTWCNDDYSGKNPGIAGQWLSGTYEIWIGSSEANTYHPYVIQMTEQQ